MISSASMLLHLTGGKKEACQEWVSKSPTFNLMQIAFVSSF